MDDKKNNRIITQEKNVINRTLKRMRGNDFLQIGGLGYPNFSEHACVTRRFFLDKDVTKGVAPFIQAQSDCLPIQSETMDIVLLVHQLETAKNAMDILSESYRVLRSNGQLIILGFNRWSLYHFLHHQKNFHSMTKIKRQLRQLNFEIKWHHTFYFCAPFIFLETLGQLLLPYAGAAFVIVATKNTVGVTPLIANGWEKKFALQ